MTDLKKRSTVDILTLQIAILRISHKSVKNGRTLPFRLPKACHFQASEGIDTRSRMTSGNLTERTHDKTTKVLMVLMH